MSRQIDTLNNFFNIFFNRIFHISVAEITAQNIILRRALNSMERNLIDLKISKTHDATIALLINVNSCIQNQVQNEQTFRTLLRNHFMFACYNDPYAVTSTQPTTFYFVCDHSPFFHHLHGKVSSSKSCIYKVDERNLSKF